MLTPTFIIEPIITLDFGGIYGVTSIQFAAFEGCRNITSVIIPDSVTYIGNYSFCECVNLTSTVIPNNVYWIGSSAFYNCSNLKNVYYTGNEQEWDIIYTGEKGIGTYIDGGNDCLKNAETHYNYIYGTETEQNNNITVILDGRQIKFDVPPQLINDRTMVPMRAIFEAIGAVIEWNEDTNTVTAYKDDKTISLTIGETNMYVNDKTVELDSPACIVNDRTLVPVRAISESLDLAVNWIGETNMVEIKTPQ